MKQIYINVLKRLIENLDDKGNITQLRTATGYGASHPYPRNDKVKRVYGKSEIQYQFEEDEEIEEDEEFEPVKVSKAFLGKKYEQYT